MVTVLEEKNACHSAAGESVRAVAEELGIRRSGCRFGKIATRSWVRPDCGGGAGSGWQRGSGLRSWNARWGGKNWNWIVSPKPCSASEWAGSDLHVDRGAGRARRPHGRTWEGISGVFSSELQSANPNCTLRKFGGTGIFSLHANVRSHRHHQTCVLLLLGPLSKAMTARGLRPFTLRLGPCTKCHPSQLSPQT